MKRLLLLLVLIAVPLTAQTGSRSKENDSQTISVSGTVATFNDTIGSQSDSWELVVAGSPATLTVTVVGCMRGGTCSGTLVSSSGTGSQVITSGGTVYDYYNVTASWTGGSSPSVTVNRTGTAARSSSGGPTGTVTSVAATAPITAAPSPITGAGTIACPTCMTGTTPTNHGVLLGKGTQAVGATAAGATNTLLHGNTGADPNYSAVVDADLSGQVGLAHGGTNADLSASGSTTAVLAQDASHVVTARSLVAGDIPNLAASKITSGTLALAQGGTAADLSATGSTTAVLAQDASHAVTARSLVAGDIPSLAASKITSGQIALAQGGTNADLSGTGGTSQFLKQASVGAAVTVVRPACADLSNAAASCSTDATNATNITTGTLPAAQLPSGVGRNLYTESTSAGATTTATGSALNMFTGYTMPANTLTAGHSLHIHACFKHTTGSASMTYQVSIGGVGTTIFAASTGAQLVCADEVYTSVDSTHEQWTQSTLDNPSGTITAPQQAARTDTLSSSNVINFTQSGTAGDVMTAYQLTIDLF